MKKGDKKTKIGSSKVSKKAKNDDVKKGSEQSEEIATEPSESVDAVEDATRVSTTNAKVRKKRVVEKNVEESPSESENDGSIDISDKKTNVSESSDEVIVCIVAVEDTHKRCADEKKVESTNEPGSEDADESLNVNKEITVKPMKMLTDDTEGDSASCELVNEDNIVADSAATESTEGVLKDMSSVDVTVVSTECSTEVAEEVPATSEQCEEVTTDVSKCRKRENVDDNTPSSDVLEQTDGDTDTNIANKRSRLEVTDAASKSDALETNKCSRKIFVGGLPHDITEYKLGTYFEAYGHVMQVDLVRDHKSNRPRGFGFVLFEKEESANNCIKKGTHVICQKECEAKLADNSRFSGSSSVDWKYSATYNRKTPQIQQRNAPKIGFNLPQMLSQAFLIGRLQQHASRPAMHPSLPFMQNRTQLLNHLPTLLKPVGSMQPTYNNIPVARPQHNNILLQALINRQIVPSTHIRPMLAFPTAPSVPMFIPTAPGNTAAFNLLTQRIRAYPQNK